MFGKTKQSNNVSDYSEAKSAHVSQERDFGEAIEEKKIPKHISIIMNGNEDWALERNLPSEDGYLKGFQKTVKIPGWFFVRNVDIVSILFFSSDEWNKPQEEVNMRMKIIKKFLQDNLRLFNEKGYKIIFSGEIEELPGNLSEICHDTEDKTKNNNRGLFNIYLNYGGQAEIIRAMKKMIKNNITSEQVHKGMFKKYLYSDLDDPEIIICTGGKQNLQGMQLWQSANSELMFMKKFWPDFEEGDVKAVLEEYISRNP